MSDFVRSLPRQTRGGISWRRLIDFDWILVTLLLLLVIYGLVILWSALDRQHSIFYTQVIKIGIGFFLMYICIQIDSYFIKRLAPVLYISGLLCLLAVLLIGVEVNGSRRWLNLIAFRVQPSEFMKLIVPIAVSAYLVEKVYQLSSQKIIVVIILVLIPALLINHQPDLGTSLLVTGSGMILLFLFGISWKWIFKVLGLGLICLPVIWFFVLKSYQKGRILTFLNPDRDPLGAGWNILQSKTAIGSGGFYGKGWFGGTQSRYDFLPESHTDFILALIGEEFGFLGILLLVVLYLLILLRCFFLAYQAKNLFSKLLIASLSFTFFMYIFVNIAMVIGLLPVVGVPLPLISYGGSSMLSILMTFGFILSAARESRY